MNTTTNTQIEPIVTEYAKANKINKAKLLAFAEQIAEIASRAFLSNGRLSI